ncbi:hypothetical protein QE152_g6483 [Popillia japonica]|uniref:Uncharacterized protein n=1 Tax=Popillia japonica TaxID=7064 RepID=A0AAW1MED6_POPJA
MQDNFNFLIQLSLNVERRREVATPPAGGTFFGRNRRRQPSAVGKWRPHPPAEPSSEGTVADSHGMGSSRAEMGNTDEASRSDLSLRGEKNAQIRGELKWGTLMRRPVPTLALGERRMLRSADGLALTGRPVDTIKPQPDGQSGTAHAEDLQD